MVTAASGMARLMYSVSVCSVINAPLPSVRQHSLVDRAEVCARVSCCQDTVASLGNAIRLRAFQNNAFGFTVSIVIPIGIASPSSTTQRPNDETLRNEGHSPLCGCSGTLVQNLV